MDNNIDNNDTDYMLTTVDNPFSPFSQWDLWLAYDTEKGYFTCAYLARIAKTSDELSEKDQSIAINNGINEIVSIDSWYKKVTEDSFKTLSKDS